MSPCSNDNSVEPPLGLSYFLVFFLFGFRIRIINTIWLVLWTSFHPPRIGPVHRIIADVRIQIKPAGLSDGVGLQEPAEARVIDPIAVMECLDLRDLTKPR